MMVVMIESCVLVTIWQQLETGLVKYSQRIFLGSNFYCNIQDFNFSKSKIFRYITSESASIYQINLRNYSIVSESSYKSFV